MIRGFALENDIFLEWEEEEKKENKKKINKSNNVCQVSEGFISSIRKYKNTAMDKKC